MSTRRGPPDMTGGAVDVGWGATTLADPTTRRRPAFDTVIGLGGAETGAGSGTIDASEELALPDEPDLSWPKCFALFTMRRAGTAAWAVMLRGGGAGVHMSEVGLGARAVKTGAVGLEVATDTVGTFDGGEGLAVGSG